MTKSKNNSRKSASDAISFKGTLMISGSATASLRAFDYHLVNCNSTNGIARTQFHITDSFQLYRYKRLRFTWVPLSGPSDSDAGAIVKVQYITSPEDIVYFTQTATSANAITFINATDNFHVFNVWKERTFNIPLSRLNRRQWYSVDTVAAGSTANDHERMTQGMVAVTMEAAINNAVVLGHYKIDYEIELKGLSSTPGT